VQVAKDGTLPAELARETLAAICDRAIGMCRKWGANLIVFKKGLGKLRSGGRNHSLNRLLNFWTRSLLVNMMKAQGWPRGHHSCRGLGWVLVHYR